MSRSKSNSSTIDDVRIGQVFADRYEIVRRIGTGGMAVVYAGIDRMLMRDVALKILKPQVMDDPYAVERLRREARAAGQLHHRHIITFHDVGSCDGTVFIVMELLRGRTLAAERRRCRRLPAARVVRIGMQVASALRVVHEAGIVHRDLKPDNVFLLEHATDDFCKLLDFSIAKLPSTLAAGRITQSGAVHGTPHYMPPEQAVGDPVSPASDIYSLGAVLFELLVGRAPFQAASAVELLTVQSTEDAPRVRFFEPDVPEALDELVASMLSRSSHQRPATAERLYDALLVIAEQCEKNRGEPPRLQRKRIAAADQTLQSAPFQLPIEESERPTTLMDAIKIRAPSASQSPATEVVVTALRPKSRAVQRPTSSRGAAASRRSNTSMPSRSASSRHAASRAVARARQRAVQREDSGGAPPPSDAEQNERDPQSGPPEPPKPFDLPDAPAKKRRPSSRNHRSTEPNWSGQSSPALKAQKKRSFLSSDGAKSDEPDA